jgi:hypothetical protein
MNAFQDGPSGTWQVTGPGQRTIAYVAGQSHPDTSPGAAGPPLTAGARAVDAVGGADRPCHRSSGPGRSCPLPARLCSAASAGRPRPRPCAGSAGTSASSNSLPIPAGPRLAAIFSASCHIGPRSAGRRQSVKDHDRPTGTKGIGSTRRTMPAGNLVSLRQAAALAARKRRASAVLVTAAQGQPRSAGQRR